MPRISAFLRAVNVGSRHLSMAELRQLWQDLGFTEVDTFITSGNVIFTARSRNTKQLEEDIEAHLDQALGYKVHTFLRSVDEVSAIARGKPFPKEELEAAAGLYVAFARDRLTPAQVRAVNDLASETDRFRVSGREIFWLRRTRSDESRFSYKVLEKAIGGLVTFRNINTVRRLAETIRAVE